MWATLRKQEEAIHILEDFLATKEARVNVGMRTILVDWLDQVADVLCSTPACGEVGRRTVHQAVAALDRFLPMGHVTTEDLQMVGATCLMLAAKLIESAGDAL